MADMVTKGLKAILVHLGDGLSGLLIRYILKTLRKVRFEMIKNSALTELNIHTPSITRAVSNKRRYMQGTQIL